MAYLGPVRPVQRELDSHLNFSDAPSISRDSSLHVIDLIESNNEYGRLNILRVMYGSCRTMLAWRDIISCLLNAKMCLISQF